KGEPKMSVDKVLALAVTGWLRGDTAAEPDPKMARGLWQLRELLLAKPPVPSTITEHCQKYKLGTDLVAQIIPLLPPADPPEMKNDQVKLAITAPDSAGGDYWVQLPPEYHPNRSYPLLIVLHGAGLGESATDTLQRWSDLANKNGFIVA